MTVWQKYRTIIINNFEINPGHWDVLGYWKNSLFAQTIIFALPLSLISLVPGLIYCWQHELYLFFIIDLIGLAIFCSVGFLPGLKINVRKFLFIFCLYFLSINFVILLGPKGPGLLFLLSASFFVTIIFSNKYAYYPAFLNLIICLVVAFVIQLDVMPWRDDHTHTIGEWLAVSSNLVLISFLSSALIPMIFKGLQNTIQKEQQLSKELDSQNAKLAAALKDLKGKNDELEAFAFTASHDLQEPLRMITSFLTLIQSRYGQIIDEKGQQYIRFAVDGAMNMRQIILDILDYSRVGEFPTSQKSVDLNEVIESIKKIFFSQIDEHKIVITHDRLPMLAANRTSLFQIFNNLLTNAIKYRKVDVQTKIHIGVADAGEMWKFSVSDNGIGISPEYHQKIFVIFQRLHTKAQYSGSGMGLALAKKIVENRGGSIWVDSAEGVGSTFFFTLPKDKIQPEIQGV